MKLVYVLRHAKSSWDDSSLDDHDRPLSARGRKAAARIGSYIEQNGIEPDLVLCSTALRARETLEGIKGAFDERGSIEFEEDLYLAAAGSLIDRLAAVGESTSSVMLIGHNPGLADLVVGLAQAGPDLERVRTKFPTGALATLSFDGAWRELTRGQARLTGFVVPRELG